MPRRQRHARRKGRSSTSPTDIVASKLGATPDRRRQGLLVTRTADVLCSTRTEEQRSRSKRSTWRERFTASSRVQYSAQKRPIALAGFNSIYLTAPLPRSYHDQNIVGITYAPPAILGTTRNARCVRRSVGRHSAKSLRFHEARTYHRTLLRLVRCVQQRSICRQQTQRRHRKKESSKKRAEKPTNAIRPLPAISCELGYF